jgi:hypothetical protein
MEEVGRNPVRHFPYSVLAFPTIALILGCGKPLPAAYGIYANTDHGQITLKQQQPRSIGNMFSSTSGLTGPSGPECDALKSFIIYQKDVEPSRVGLERLSFVQSGQISNLLSVTQVRINLWQPVEHIDMEIRPVEERRDMYTFVPRTPLPKGFYSLHVGSFYGGQVYDIVVGSAKDFPSYADAQAKRGEEAKKAARSLLAQLNDLLNRGDYSRLQEVYRPSGRALSNEELKEFAEKNQTWLGNAGKILNSEVTAVTVLDGSNSGRCSVKTTYEKAGAQGELVTIAKIGDRYFITEIQ